MSHPHNEIPESEYPKVLFSRLLYELIYVTAEMEGAGRTADFRRRQLLIRAELFRRYTEVYSVLEVVDSATCGADSDWLYGCTCVETKALDVVKTFLHNNPKPL